MWLFKGPYIALYVTFHSPLKGHIEIVSTVLSFILFVTWHHEIVLTRYEGRMIPTSVPDLFKPTSALESAFKP